MAPPFTSVISTVWPSRTWTIGPGAPWPSNAQVLYLSRPGLPGRPCPSGSSLTFATSPASTGGSAASYALCASASACAFGGTMPAKLFSGKAVLCPAAWASAAGWAATPLVLVTRVGPEQEREEAHDRHGEPEQDRGDLGREAPPESLSSTGWDERYGMDCHEMPPCRTDVSRSRIEKNPPPDLRARPPSDCGFPADFGADLGGTGRACARSAARRPARLPERRTRCPARGPGGPYVRASKASWGSGQASAIATDAFAASPCSASSNCTIRPAQ